MSRAAVVALGLLVLLAVFAPALSPFDGAMQDRLHALAAPDARHLLGTDGLGRDELVRLALGVRISLAAGGLATLVALVLGGALGLCAGFFGGWLDSIAMRAGELTMSLPWFYLIVGIRAVLPLTLSPAAIVLTIGAVAGLTGWPRPGRLIRGIVLSERERDYVTAARGFGASNFYLMRRHVAPAVYEVARIQAALLFSQFILAESALSFLGLGVGEPAASLGNMLASLRDIHLITSSPWMLSPAAVLILLSASFQSLARDTRPSRHRLRTT